MIVGGIRNCLKVPKLFFWSVRRPCKIFSFSPSGLFLVKSEVQGILDIFKSSKLILLVIQDVMQNFKIVALLLLCYFWLVIKMWKISVRMRASRAPKNLEN